ncbi:MAG: hypothetical protein M1834_003741 [Cirrosporium novae-zelandiae]|nr:MAG: hypothetical protein M1834_003741 [Cirrosporium novae-zelandiae]
MPAVGHVNPFQPLAAALIQGGHEVVWLTTESFRALVEQSGATFAPMKRTPDFEEIPIQPDDEDSSSSSSSGGLSAAVSIMRRLFIDRIEGQVADYQEVLRTFLADALVVDMCSLGAHTLRDLGGPVYATVGINPLVTPDPEIPPWGAGTMPPQTMFGRLLNRLTHFIGSLLFDPKVMHLINVKRALFHLPPLPSGVRFDSVLRSSALHIMPTTLAFEYPRRNLSPQIRFVGPLLPLLPDSFETPTWWPSIATPSPPKKTVIYVTQGTYANTPTNLILPTIRALSANESVIVIVTTGPTTLSVDPLPTNVYVANYIHHFYLLPHVDLMITNGGYNGVLSALSYGIPLICAGRSEDKADVSARVAWSGVGIDLRTDNPTDDMIKGAVEKILMDGSYNENAERIKQSFKSHDSAREGCLLLERLVDDENPTIVTRVPQFTD